MTLKEKIEKKTEAREALEAKINSMLEDFRIQENCSVLVDSIERKTVKIYLAIDQDALEQE